MTATVTRHSEFTAAPCTGNEWAVLRDGHQWMGVALGTISFGTEAEALAECKRLSTEQLRLETLRHTVLLELALEYLELYRAQPWMTAAEFDLMRSEKLAEVEDCDTFSIPFHIDSFRGSIAHRRARDEELRARGKRKGNSGAKERLLALYGPSCNLCGLSEAVHPVADHIVPWAHGGVDGMDNLQLACNTCNAAKSDKFAGSLNHERLAAALAASPTYTGEVRYL